MTVGADVNVDLGRVFLTRSRFYLNEEYRTKIRRAVEAMPDSVIWDRPHDASNSVGNLLLHLAGNVRQWIVSGVGGAPDTRQRGAEFGATGGASTAELLDRLDAVLTEADAVLARLGPDDLVQRRVIQDRDLTVMAAIYSCVQHFSTHLGQIIMIAKEQSPGAIRFYEDTPDGKAKPIWRRTE